MPFRSRRRSTLPATLAAAALLALSASTLPPSDAATGFPVRAGALQRWVPLHMAGGGLRGLADTALATAERFDLVMGNPGSLGSYASEMKAANPDLTLVVYLNGVYTSPGDLDLYDASWLARDSAGNPVRSRAWGNYMMDMSNFRWWGDRARACARILGQGIFDHCYFDNLGAGPLSKNYNTSFPIDPRTGNPWTVPDLFRADLAMLRRISTKVPGPLLGNGLSNGARYFHKDAAQRSSLLFEELDGAHSEIFLRDRGTPLNGFKTEAKWKQDVDMLVDAGARGKVVLTTTKLWGTRPTQAQIDQWHKYALASFLLGTDGRSYFHFSETNSLEVIVRDHLWDRVNVGAPVSPYSKRDGAYRRDFTKGIALVNPTLVPVTVPLAGRYRDLGGTIRTAVTLSPNSGEVLTSP